MSLFFDQDNGLQQLGDRLLESVWAAFPGLARNQLALTWLVYDPPSPMNTGGALTAEAFWQYTPRGYSYRGVERIDPAGIVRLFYLVAVQEWLERGMAQPSAELDRAVRDMIVDASHDATSLVVDVLTGTTSGPELAPGPFATWKVQRNLINRYLESFGWTEFQTININQKTWCDGAYGRERIFLGELLDNRNMLTTIATARLLHSIVGGVAVSAIRSQTMMNLFRRSLTVESRSPQLNHPITGFLGAGLPMDACLWSTATETPQVRHDAAYIELPDCHPYLLVVFMDSREFSKNESILPFISRQVVEGMRSLSHSVV
ncbi:serine hydrolase [Pantanalinema rosaneae CENA516]|uniref:serine hydrolase n=1 Tax=Pantanalinema rosaneae TaxID=1620701 RepID=UPI003D6E397C